MKKSSVYTIIVLVVLVPVIYFLFIHEKKLPRPEIKIQHTLVEPENHDYSFDNPPVFKSESEVRFLDAATNTLISKIDVEVADTDFDRALGLMFRSEMADSLGMLFLFDKEEVQAFWMRNTIMSLDIIYINAQGKIVKIYKNAPTQSDASMPSEKPAMYVVEVNGGYCDSHGVEVGNIVEF